MRPIGLLLRQLNRIRRFGLIKWVARAPSVAQRDARLKAVCRFVRHIRVEDARHELQPANHFGARKTRRSPHIYSAAEIERLIEAALRLRPKGGLRQWTYATLIALLSVTGLRISEALKLTVADVTPDGLLIRETKFRKTRLAPLHDTAAAGLEGYLARRRLSLYILGGSLSLFVPSAGHSGGPTLGQSIRIWRCASREKPLCQKSFYGIKFSWLISRIRQRRASNRHEK
jgi:integrase